MDEHGYVMATIPSTPGWHVPVIGFIAHVDTSPEMQGHDVRPIVHRSYDGRDLVLPDDPSAVLRAADDPALAGRIGHDIVTASGLTLLGADDKAGVAEIMAAAEYLMAHPEIPHGAIRVGVHARRGDRTRRGPLRRRGIRRAVRLHAGRRQRRRARVGELLRRRDDRDVQGLQHASGLRQGPDGERDQARSGFHRAAAAGPPVAGDDRRLRGLRPSVRQMDASVDRTSVRLLIRDFLTAGLEEKEAFVEELAREVVGRSIRGAARRDPIEESYRNMREMLEGIPKSSSARAKRSGAPA